jgi:LDH2 family malate/lactate/ureidoglycolate dehydrogenase
VLIPGEPEAMSCARRLRDGIPVPEDTWNAIRETATNLSLDVPIISS